MQLCEASSVERTAQPLDLQLTFPGCQGLLDGCSDCAVHGCTGSPGVGLPGQASDIGIYYSNFQQVAVKCLVPIN